jgi:hypothetical protein
MSYTWDDILTNLVLNDRLVCSASAKPFITAPVKFGSNTRLGELVYPKSVTGYLEVHLLAFHQFLQV